MATHGSTQHWDGEGDLRERLQDELADVQAALLFVLVVNAFDMHVVDVRAAQKMELLAKWHDEGERA
jgi:hypothetical protein